MRVLLVEDDPATSRSIELMLTHANLNVYCTDLGEEGIDLAKLYDYDLILLDLNLPDMNGHEVLRQLRLARVETPILILSGSDDSENKLKGFGFGADDYMTKPFHREELVARIHAIIRRSKGHAQSIIRTGEINVNLDAKTVDVNGEMVHLTGKEYQMLELLSLRKGTTLTKEMWHGVDELERLVGVGFSRGQNDLTPCIETVFRGAECEEPAQNRSQRLGGSAGKVERSGGWDIRAGAASDDRGNDRRARDDCWVRGVSMMRADEVREEPGDGTGDQRQTGLKPSSM